MGDGCSTCVGLNFDAQEILAASHNSNIETVFLKLDFVKAFDSVSWDSLFELLLARGFGYRWIGWIKTCLLSGTSSILVIGKPGKYIQCRKGLRQGDPLSPCLFFIVTDTLTRILSLSDGNGSIQKVAPSLDRMILLAYIMPMTHFSLCWAMLYPSSLLSYLFTHLRWWRVSKSILTNHVPTTWVDVKRWAREPLPFSNAILVHCHLTTLGYQSKWPHSQGRIDNHLLKELRKNLPLGRVALYLRAVGSFSWTPVYLHCLYTLCPTILRSGWSWALIVSVMPSSGKAKRTFMEEFAWLIGNLFAPI